MVIIFHKLPLVNILTISFFPLEILTSGGIIDVKSRKYVENRRKIICAG